MIGLVRQYRKKQLKLRFKLGDAWEGGNYVFIQWNGRQIYPSTPYGVFKDVIHRYNATVEDGRKKPPDIPLHGLRHPYVKAATKIFYFFIFIFLKHVYNKIVYQERKKRMSNYYVAL